MAEIGLSATEMNPSFPILRDFLVFLIFLDQFYISCLSLSKHSFDSMIFLEVFSFFPPSFFITSHCTVFPLYSTVASFTLACIWKSLLYFGQGNWYQSLSYLLYFMFLGISRQDSVTTSQELSITFSTSKQKFGNRSPLFSLSLSCLDFFFSEVALLNSVCFPQIQLGCLLSFSQENWFLILIIDSIFTDFSDRLVPPLEGEKKCFP